MRGRGAAFSALVVALLAGSASAEHGTPGTTQLISRPSGTAVLVPGQVSFSSTLGPSAISADGAFVAFVSGSDGLSSDDDNAFQNVFLRDMHSASIILVSRANGASGAAAHGNSFDPAISRDGKRVAFATTASLDPADTNGVSDVYVRDVTSNRTWLVSRAAGATGAVGNAESTRPSLNDDGDFVAFESAAGNLDPADTTGFRDIFAHVISSNETALISRATGNAGAGGNGDSSEPSIDGSGFRVAFLSDATNLAANDTNMHTDVFVRNIIGIPEATTVLVSQSGGTVGNSRSDRPAMSRDGNHVAFESFSTNLDAADTNSDYDVYERTLSSPSSTLVSRGANGVGNDYSYESSISDDGSKVAFISAATNLSTDDPKDYLDVYVRNLTAGTTVLASRASGATGAVANGTSSYQPSISGDGNRVVFYTAASNLVPGISGEFSQVYIRDLSTSSTAVVSNPFSLPVDDSGSGVGGGSLTAGTNHVSSDGRFVVFASAANRLSPDDDDRYENVFVRDTVTNTTTLVSRAAGPGGAAANNHSSEETISANGSTVAFVSKASNLVPGDTNDAVDVFVRTLATGKIVRVGSTTDAYAPSLSGDGRKVAFVGAGFTAGVDPNVEHIFVRDLVSGATTLASRADGSAGQPGDYPSKTPAISFDGTKVAFISAATNLGGPTDGTEQAYVRDLAAARTVLASRASGPAGPAGDSHVFKVAISGNGNAVAFASFASNLVSGDLNDEPDVFVRNLATNTTTLVSSASGPAGAPTGGFDGTINADGTRVAFVTASPLAPDDTNGQPDIYVRDLSAATTTRASVPAPGVPASPGSGAFAPFINASGDCVAYYSDTPLLPSAPRSDFGRVYLTTLRRECPAVPPDTTLTSGPSQRSKLRRPTFSFSANEAGSTFECRLDSGTFAKCGSPFTTPRLADGKHTFFVRAVDPATYADPTAASRTWTIDAIGPRLKVRVPSQKRAAVIGKGLRVLVRSSEAGRVRFLLLDGRKVVGKGSGKLKRGQKQFRIRLTAAGKRNLHSRLRLKITAKDTLGNASRPLRRTVKLK